MLFAGGVNAEILCIDEFIYRNEPVTAFRKNLQYLPQCFRRIFHIVMKQQNRTVFDSPGYALHHLLYGDTLPV